LAWGGDNARIGLWDVSTRRRLGLRSESSDWIIAYSPDGNILATVNDTTLLLWDVATLRPLTQPLGRHTSINQITFSPNGKWLAAYGNDYAELWDVSTPRDEVRGPMKTPGMSLDFSPDGKSFAAGDSEGTISIYDLNTMAQVGEPLKGHDGPVSILAYNNDGRLLISAGRDATLRVWDVVARKLLVQPLTGHDGAVWGMTLTPDGLTLASGSLDNTIRLWDPTSGKQLAVLLGHAALCEHLAFSPDSKILASCSTDSICMLWDVPTRQLLVKFRVELEVESSSSVAFSADGKMLLTGSSDIILWGVSLDSWKARACKIANRNLTSPEWIKYFGDEPRRKTCPDLPLP
jgi:WD40 repeat protein